MHAWSACPRMQRERFPWEPRGESLEDALANAHDAIAGYLESLPADGEPIPRETHPAIAATIVVTPDAA